MPSRTQTLGNRDPFEPYETAQITHISPQMQFMVRAIVSSLNTFRRGKCNAIRPHHLPLPACMQLPNTYSFFSSIYRH